MERYHTIPQTSTYQRLPRVGLNRYHWLEHYLSKCVEELCILKPRYTRDIYITTTKVDLCHSILPNNTNPHSFTYSWRIVQQNNSIPHQTLACLLFLKPRTKDQQTFYTCTSTLWEINIIYADIILEIEKNIQVLSKNNHFSMACLS